MEKAYKYTAKSQRGQLVHGIIYAEKKAIAFSKLKKGQMLPISMEFALKETIQGWINPDFNKKELARFYTTIGRRLSRGAPFIQGLDAAVEYLSDPRLIQAILIMRQGIMDGQPEYTAMTTAGFPRRDTLILRAAFLAGKSADAFLSLADEVTRVEKLRKSLRATFRLPKIMGGFMAIFIWLAIMYVAPAVLTFLKSTGLKMQFNMMLTAYFEFVKLYHTNTTLSTIFYFGALAGAIAFIRSDRFKELSDKIETLRMLSLKSDHATTWNSFYLLYSSAVAPKEASHIVADAASRQDTKDSFIKLGKQLEAGRELSDAVNNSGFPSFIISGMKAAESSGNLTLGLRDMVGNLEEDANSLTELVQETAKFGSIVFMGLGILVVFIMTYYPMVSSVLSNA